MSPTASLRQTNPRSRAPIALGAVLLLAALIAAAWPGDAGSAPPPTVLLGKTTSTPRPACPGTGRQECQAIGRVTGFQALAGNEGQPFVAPFDGAVVAWSVTLSRPNRKERSFFDDLFGSPPKARIAILRRIKGKRPPAFMMVRQSPVQVLTPYLGHTVVFALVHPLVVLKGQVVALTIPTWAPALAIDLNGSRNTWRGSRKAGACSSSDKDIESSNPQQRVRSKRQYGCYFSTSRLLYTATVVKKPVKKQRRSRAARARRGVAIERAVPVG